MDTRRQIPFTQFILPNGKRKDVLFNVDQGIEPFSEAAIDLAWELIDSGCNFEIEILRNGVVSIECMLGEDSLAGELCENGPPVVTAIEKMILSAHRNFKPRGVQ